MRCRATGFLLAAAVAGCTPVSLPEGYMTDEPEPQARLGYDPATRRLQVGERVPDFALVDGLGQSATLSEMHDDVLVVTFYAGDERGEAMLERMRAVDTALVDRLVDATRILVVLLTPLTDADDRSSRDADRLRADAERFAASRTEWMFARPEADVAAPMAGAFGVAMWESGSGEVQHTFSTVVLDRNGRIADLFRGIDDWRVGDLIGAISLAADR